MTRLKAIGLFFIAPFIGLAYIVVLPWYCVYQAISCSVEKTSNITVVVAEKNKT